MFRMEHACRFLVHESEPFANSQESGLPSSIGTVRNLDLLDLHLQVSRLLEEVVQYNFANLFLRRGRDTKTCLHIYTWF